MLNQFFLIVRCTFVLFLGCYFESVIDVFHINFVVTKVINDSEFITIFNIEDFQYQHQLHLGSTYKSYWVNMHMKWKMFILSIYVKII